MKKKAQGLPLNVVVVMALLLVMLIILFFILSKGSGKFRRGIGDCSAKKGSCVEKNECAGIAIPLAEQCAASQVCCVLPEKLE